jgi:uncharacterized membrane protein YeaQ/YmgE (transglycosylase-associated protein family)
MPDGTRAGRTKETIVFQILGLIVVGAIIGVLARLILPGKQNISTVMTVVLGIAGAIVGGLIAHALGIGEITELNVGGFLLAVVAALVFVGLYAGVAGKSRGSIR